jgi:hypothetical protein
MSTLRVTNLKGGSAGSAPNLPDGAVITGVATVGVLSATTFYGNGANLTGIDATALKDSGGNVKIQANSDGAVVTGVLTAPTVSGTTGSFTGNVSVGGTLTYEDVTNVDSVGLITARNGVKVTGGDVQVGTAVTVDTSGINVTGIVTATSFVGDGSGLTDVPGGNIISGIASGSIASDKCMSLTHDGKILQMATKVTANNNPSQSGGTWGPYGGSTEKMNVLYVPGADRFVMFMRDASARFRYNVINIVGPQMINNGTQLFGGEDPGGARWYPIRSVNLGNSMIAVLYSDTNNHGQGKIAIGTVVPNNSTGGTITFPNSPPIFTGNYSCTYGDICYDPNQDKIVIVYQYSNSQGQAIVGDVSGTGSSATVTFGTPVDINGSNNAQNLACVYDESASRVVITWENHGDSRKLYGRTASVSGTTITMGGSATDLNGGSTGADLWLTMSYAGSPQNMSVVAYRIGGVGMVSKALSVSGDTITAYTRQTVHASGNWLWGNVKYDNGIGRICYFYVRDGNSEASAIIMADLATNGTISNFSNFHEFDTSNTAVIWGDTNEVGRGVCGYKDDNGSHTEAATPIVGAEGGNISDPGQYLGFADQAYTDGQTVTVITLGNTKAGLVGLTTGSTYYAQADGTIATTWDSARFAAFATNTPKAGRALNSTSLQIFQPS